MAFTGKENDGLNKKRIKYQRGSMAKYAVKSRQNSTTIFMNLS